MTGIIPRPAGEAGFPDPDSRARTHLANERTLLAWIRTGLNMMALGLVSAQFLEDRLVAGIPVVTVFAALLVLSGIVMAATAGYHYHHSYIRIEAGQFRSSTRMVVMAVVLTLMIGLLGLVFVFNIR